MSGNFESILNKTFNEVPEPSLYPTGTWQLRCVSTFAGSDDDGNDTFNFYFIGVSPMDDVDQQELAQAAAGLDGVRINVKRTIESATDAKNLRSFLRTLGVDVTQDKSVSELVKEAKGTEVLAFVSQRSYTGKDGETKFVNNLRQFVPLTADSIAA